MDLERRTMNHPYFRNRMEIPDMNEVIGPVKEVMREPNAPWNDIDAWIQILTRGLPLSFAEVENDLFAAVVQEIGLRLSSAPNATKRNRIRRLHLPYRFIVAHEISHFLLGHVGDPGTTVVTEARSLLERLDMAEGGIAHANHEHQADMLAYELCKRSLPDQEDTGRIGSFVLLSESICITMLMIHAMTVGGLPAEPSTKSHPATAVRLAAVNNLCLQDFNRLVAKTRARDVGPQGPGLFSRGRQLIETRGERLRMYSDLFHQD